MARRKRTYKPKGLTTIPISERKVFFPWKRPGFRIEPFPPNVSESVLNNVYDALAARVNPSTTRSRVDALLLGCLTAMNKIPPTTNIMQEGKEQQAAYYNAILEDIQMYGISGGGLNQKTTSVSHQPSELPENSPDLRKLHWTTVAILVHVFVTGRRLLKDRFKEDKKSLVYKEPQQQQQSNMTAQANPNEQVTVDELEDEDGNQQGSMVVGPDAGDKSSTIRRLHYNPRVPTQKEKKLIVLVDQCIQHLDACKKTRFE